MKRETTLIDADGRTWRRVGGGLYRCADHSAPWGKIIVSLPRITRFGLVTMQDDFGLIDRRGRRWTKRADGLYERPIAVGDTCLKHQTRHELEILAGPLNP